MFQFNMRERAWSWRRVGRLTVEVFRKYSEDGGPVLAAAISFFALLSIIPLILLGVWGLGQFLSSEDAFRTVADYLNEYLPVYRVEVRRYLHALVESRGTIGWLGVAGLLWSGSQGFVVLEAAMNLALRVPERRSFLESRLLGLAMVLLAGGLLALSLVTTSALAAIQHYRVPIVDRSAADIPILWSAVGQVVPVLLTVLSFSVVYRVVPNSRMTWRSAAIAGTTAGLLWEIAKRGFAYFLSHVPAYNRIYGPISSAIGLVFWIYYSSAILMLGAELASVLQNVHPHRGSLEPPSRRHQAPVAPRARPKKSRHRRG